MKPTVCLTMIVKNEAHIIERCLDSVSPFIDSFFIGDTGSTDGTPETIRAWGEVRGIPGNVANHTWEDFGTNRTHVFVGARHVENPADYALVIDADDVLEFTNFEAAVGMLGKFDMYDFNIKLGNHFFRRPQLFRQSLPWLYKGTMHEHADCPVPFTRGPMPGIVYSCIGGGGRKKDPQREKKEIALLRKQLKVDPENTRATFYLAQTFHDQWKLPAAIYWNEKVLTLRGWTEERFLAAMRLGDMYRARDVAGDFERAIDRYMRAIGINGRRVEPYEKIARFIRLREAEGWASVSYFFAKKGSEIVPDPSGFLVDVECHEVRIWDELSLAAFYSGQVEEAIVACRKVIHNPLTPAVTLKRAITNLGFMGHGRVKQVEENSK